MKTHVQPYCECTLLESELPDKSKLWTSVRLLLLILILGTFSVIDATGQNSATFTSSTNWVCPAGVNCVKVETWGAGGGGSTITSNGARGGGGGGGAYASSFITVVPGNSYPINVGTPGPANTAGGDSWFITSGTVMAKGGSGGSNNSTAAGAGGSGAASVGITKYSGGAGANGGGSTSGAGGGGAGSNGVGGPASGGTAGTGTAANGGNGGNGVSGSSNGNSGNIYGGGGSGAVTNSNTDRTGGPGAGGLIKLTWVNVSNFSISNNSPICANTASIITVSSTSLATGAYIVTYDLSGANSATGNTASMNFAGISGTFTTSVLANGGSTTLTITGIAFAGPGCNTSVVSGNTTNITVNSPPSLSVTPTSQTSCSGTTITQIDITNPNDEAGVTFTWTRTTPGGLTGMPNSGSGSTITGTLTNSTTAPITTTFTITATIGTCSSTTTANVTVNPIPTVSATNTNQTVCSGANITNIVITNPNGVAGTIFNWSRDNTVNLTGLVSGTGSPISGNIGNNTFVPQTTIFTITASLGSCSSTTTATIHVNPGPTVSATPSSQSTCSGTAITTIDISNPNSYPGTTYGWTRTTAPGLAGMPNSGGGSTTISGTLTNSTTAPITVTFTITASGGGCSSSTTVTVTVNPIPTVSATNTNQTVCSETAITNIVVSNPNGISGATFNWSRDNTINLTGIAASGTGSPVSGTLTNNTNTAQTTVFTINASANGCPGPTTTATILVNPKPTVNATPATQTICSGSAINQIDVTNPNTVSGTTFTWTRNNSVNLTGIASTGSGASITGNLTNNTTTQQTTTFTITATAGTCISSTTVNVIVNPGPVVNNISNVSYCNGAVGAAINFGSNIAGSTFAWTSTADVGFGLSGNGNIPGFTAANGPVTATVSVTATASSCPGPVKTFTITINPLPSVTIAADYCIVPGKVRLTANPLPTGTYTYLWSTGASSSVIDVDIAGSYTVTVTNINGCKATNSISIATELAVNGNFESGNSGFTSGFTYNASPNGLQPEGRYAVNENPNFNHTNFWGIDHTTGTGKMMIINGLVGPTVWQETVPVVPNTTYYFSAWAMSLNNLPPFAQLQFSVNGSTIGVSAVLVAGVTNNSNGNWQRFYGTWSSGALSSATCSIVDLQGALGGNDFALDDISISTLSPAPFSVTPSVLGGGTTVCTGSTLNLAANLTGGSSPYIFTWTGPNGFNSNLQNPSISNVTLANSGTYNLTVTDFYGCEISGSRTITVGVPNAPTPVTASPTTICLGSSSNLNGTSVTGTQSDFTGFFSTSNWTATNSPALTGGSVNTSGAPTTISITSGDNLTIGNTDYTITNGAVAGNFVFTWNYRSNELASNDIPQYSINGGAAVGLPGFNTSGANIQNGTASIAVPANQTFALRMRTVNGTAGSATTTFTNFSGPVVGNIKWYTVPTGGSSIGTSVSGANFSVTPASGGTASYYAESSSSIGCVSSARTQVNVTVNTPPSFSLCPSNISTSTAPGSCTKVVSYSATAIGSASPTLTYTFTGATTGSGSGTGSGSIFNKGVTTVTVTANTGCAPNANCSFTVTVIDAEAPVFSTCPTNAVKNTNAGVCTYTSVGAEFNSAATDNCSFTNTYGLSGATTGTGSTLAGKVFNKGVTTVTWTANDGTNSVTCTFTVTVNDNQAPSFSACPSNQTKNTNAGVCTYTSVGNEFNSTATDNCSVTSKTAVLTGATTGSGLTTLAGQVFNKGVTTVTWTATDGVNNTNCIFTVTVNDNQAPSFSACPSNQVKNANAGFCTYTSVGNEFNSTATDNCSVISKTAVLTGATTGSGLTTLTGQVFNNGVTTVTWTANDGVNNTNCVFTVTVNDNQAPVFSSCPSNTSQPADPGVCTYTSIGNEFNSTATDNCSVISKTAVLTGATTGSGLTTLTGQVFNKGVTTVTWTANDGVNNATCIFTVTVIDDQVPSIACQSDIVTCSQPSLVNPGFSDNCPGAVISNDAPGLFPVGTTIVTWTVTDASGNTATCSQNVTINPPIPATPGTITGPLTVCETSSGFIYSIPVSANALSYNWTVPTGWSITSGNGTTSITVSSGTSGQNGNISVTATNLCGTSAANSIPVSISAKGTWLGITTEWNDPSNWCEGVPTSATNVNIPVTGTGLYPIVSTAIATANDLSIAPGASLTINGEKIQIGGVITANGNFNAMNGIVELNGTVISQDIAGSMFTAKSIKDLLVSNVHGISLTGSNDTLKLSGILKFSVSGSIVNTNGNLTLVSNASGTASVGDMTNNGVNSGNNIIGNVTVERYIPNHFKAWQFMAVPTSGQTVNAAWQEGNTPLSNSNHPGYGTIITSNVPNAVGLGFDVYTPSGPTMKTYDPLTNGWVGIANPAMQIANQKGYMLFVRGDRSVTTSAQPATSTVLRTTGQLYTIGVDAPQNTNVSAGTFESVGNPYASAINFNNVTKTGGIQDLFYVWDPKLTTSTYSAYGLGAYQTVIGPGPDYMVVPGGGSYGSGNTNIESGQAFFVSAPFAGGTVSFTESCKVDGSNLVTKPANGVTKQLFNRLYVITGGNPVLLDGALSQYDASYSNDIDEMDVVKLNNSSENLSISRDNKKLVAERRKEILVTDTIFYNLGLLRVQQYQFEFIAKNLDHDGLAAFLEDNYLHTTTAVDMHDTTRILFNVVNIPGSYAADRFRLVFQRLAPTPVTITGIDANRNSDKSIAVNWKVENETNIQLYTIERSEDGTNFNGIITAPPVSNNGGRAAYTRNDISPLAHDNFYRIKALSFSGQVQYSSIVKVAPVKTIPGITVYPNPVTGKTVQLQFVGQQAGKYSIELIYSNGTQQQLKDVNVGSAQTVQAVKLPQLLGAGIYRLKIIAPDNTIILKTIHISSE